MKHLTGYLRAGVVTLGLSLAGALSALSALSAQSVSSSTAGPDVADSIPVWMSQRRVPGVALGILEGGKVRVIRSFGELRPGTPMPPNALFNVASLTKPVVALTTLALVNAGALGLDESLAPYWVDPDIRGDSMARKLTPRIILSHQTGFPNWRWLTPTKKLVFQFDPGTRMRYSGEGFEYLRRALENKFGRTLQQLSDSILFRPLGMTETTYGWDARKDSLRFATGHDTNGVALPGRKRTTADANAADWLVTTIADYSRFAEYVLSGAGLSSALYAEMVRPQVQFDGKPNEAMGLGWEVMKGPSGDEHILLHTGADDGVKTMIVLLPASGRGLVIFTTGDNGMDVALRIVAQVLRLKELTP